MTLAQLSITVALLAGLGLIASRVGLSAIPAYLLAGLLLGPNEPKALSLIRPSEVTDFVAQVGLVFLLFFLGLEFTLGRIARSRRHALVGGGIDLVLNAGLGLVVGFAAFGLSFGALAHEVGLSEAIGALMAGVVLSETSVRAEVEERFFSFRDVFAALFFFVFGLSIDVDKIGSVAWILGAAVAAALVGKSVGGYLAGLVGGLTRRQSFNAGVALVAHGEFTIILAQLASDNPQISASTHEKLVAFAGLYVLISATLGVALMKESKAIGRRLFSIPRLAEGG
jgi:CPA2 family monovalent cation:H+ antiporter-2